MKNTKTTNIESSTVKLDIDPGEFALDSSLNIQKLNCPRITVIIPTHNRKETLKKALNAYRYQTASPHEFDIIVVDDGSEDGTFDAVKSWIPEYPFQVKLLAQPSGGPAKARNRAIPEAQADLVLITGDDIIPHHKLIQAHLDAHQKYNSSNITVLGYTDWHSELEITDFMKYITEIDGHQFAYHHISNPMNVDYGYFYTSNISLKKSFLMQGDMFSETFRYAACEDVELGYRLKQRGMQMIFHPQAIGYHLHPMDVDSFSQRQFRVGQMLTILLNMHPGILDVPSPPSPEVTQNKISVSVDTLKELESQVAKLQDITDQDREQIRQLRYQMYRDIIYGHQALGMCKEQ